MRSGESRFRSGVRSDGFDLSVAAREDFFRHVNGRWLEDATIPSDRAEYGPLAVLQGEAEANLRAIIESCAEDASRAMGSEARKVGDLYASFMDTAHVEARGLEPLAEERARILGIRDTASLLLEMGRLNRFFVRVPLAFSVELDALDSERYVGYLSQSGLGLEEGDYYLKSDARSVRLRGAYQSHIEEVLELAGVAGASAKATGILALETALASKQWTRVERRDPVRAYNEKTLNELASLAPGLSWSQFFEGVRVSPPSALVVRQPDYVAALGELVGEFRLDEWKAYLEWALLRFASPYLGKAFVDAHFAFFGTALRGAETNRPRWKRGVELVDEVLGEAVGKLYVERHFSAAAKARMLEYVGHVQRAFGESIQRLSWMSDKTKLEATAKVNTFVSKIGYPETWRDYSTLEIHRHDLLGNVLRYKGFDHDRRVAKLSGPVDRREWWISPQTVNAFYNACMNEIVFPAAILQPPYFDETADDAINYGAIGAVIGHEMTHCFDDHGRKFDARGNLRDWWAPEDAKAFERLAAQMVLQYGEFSPFEDARVNGALTVGENIGDLGGVTMAYRAYKLSLGGAPAPVLDGYSGDQRFFFGWAQIMRRKYRDDELRRRLVTDSHAPARYRVNGVLANMPEFHATFDVRPGDGMWRPEGERIEIW